MQEEEFDKLYSFKFIKTIYESIIKTMTTTDKNSQVWIKYLLKHLKNKDLFYIITVFKIVDLLMKKTVVDYEKIVIWLEKIDPKFLSEEVKTYEKNGVLAQRSSQREKYYNYLSKAYEKNNELKKSKEISLEALETLKQFTNGSDIWFNRRIAICDSSVGNTQEALIRYKEITKVKNDWFILKEISDIYLRDENIEESKKKYLDALLAPGESDKKINLFIEFYNRMEKYEIKKNIADNSLKIYFKIKMDNNRSFSEKDKELAKTNDIVLTKESFPKVSIKEFFEKIRTLRWSCEEKYSGVVDTISEKFFFIKKETGERYYCKMRDYPIKKIPIQGTKLLFNLIETFDVKKNKFNKTAINISMILGEVNGC